MLWIALMIVGLVLIVLIGKVFFPADGSRSAKLMATYRRLTPDTLEALADDDLIDAVIGNLLAAAEDAKKDAYAVIPTLGQARCAVYSLWLLQKELQGDDPTVLRRAGQFGFTELAADAFDLLSMPEAAVALRDYLQTAADASIAAVRDAVADNAVNQKLIELIRSDPAAFCNEDPNAAKIGD